MQEITPEETGLETNKDVLLSQLSRQDVINFFDLDFIEQTNPNLEGTPGLGEDLTTEIEAVYLDFLIKNGATNFVPNIIPNVGYAMWRRVEVYQDDNDGSSTIVIPFANLDGDSTNAIMVAIPFEVDDFYVQQGVNRPGYYYLTTTRSELATALEDHPKINDDNVYSALLNFLVFDGEIFGYVNERWYEIYQEYDDGFTSNGTEKGTCSSSFTVCVSTTYAFSPGGSDDKSCINTTITYSWDCPGGSGGFIPGGPIGNGGTGTGSGGGGSQSSALDALNRLIAECSSETSPDVIVSNPQHGENGGNCSALLAAIENIGLYGLSPEMWLLLFEEGGDLLDLAATVSPEDQQDFALYLNFFIPGITQQNFIAFQTNLQQVEALQEELDLDVPTFMWLLQQVISVGARENNVADEIEAFLDANPGQEAQIAATKYLVFAQKTNSSAENAGNELVAFLSLQTSLANLDHLDDITQEQLDFFTEYDDFNTIDGPTDGFFGDHSFNDDEIAPAVVIYILKKAAQAGAGALADIAVQWMFEYYLGGHPDPWVAWQNLDINEWQALGSAIESATTGKYAPIVSGMTAGTTYLLSDPNPTLEGFFLNLSIGVVGGFIADNIADYVGSLRAAFTKYGFLTPYEGLTNMGIKEGVLQFVIGRRALIKAVWEDLAPTVSKGFYFEEILKYSRYSNSNIIWINSGGEQGLKLDFYNLVLNKGIQLKSSAQDFRNNLSAFRSFLNGGSNQLKDAIENGVPFNGVGSVTNGQLDIMIPSSKAGDIPYLTSYANNWLNTVYKLIPGNENLNITINVGIFDH
jgi:hypothetical protein